MIKYNEKTVSIGYINEDLIIRGEIKSKECGLKLNSTSLNKLKNINKSIKDLDKYTFKEIKEYLDKNNIEYEKVEFV